MICKIVCFFTIILVVICQKYKDVKISQGTVRGYNVDDDDVFSFYGIPYATAPTGDDKFKDALPPRNWTNIFHANISKIICPQTFTMFSKGERRTLDCLVANVFRPNTDEKNLPVLVTVFGGAFQIGAGIIISSIDLVKRGLVTVTFNYRVGVLGYLCLNTEFAPGNAGLKDSLLALKWIKSNIEDFGGDPNNIFLHGCSSGSYQVELLMLHEDANDLFHKASTESGTAIRTELKPLERAENFANTFNVSTNQSIEKLEEFYKNLSDESLNQGFMSDFDKRFIPCIETHNIKGVRKFLSEKPIDIIKSGQYLPRPLLIGLTPLEGSSQHRRYEKDKRLMKENFKNFLPNDFVYDSEKTKSSAAQKMKDLYFPGGNITKLGYIRYASDNIFTFNIMTSARLHARHTKVYLYLFSYNGTVNLPGDWKDIKSPGHGTQTMYLLDLIIYPEMYKNVTQNDRRIQNLLRDLWYNFCKYGEPIPMNYSEANITWPPMTPDKEIFLNIDINLSLGVTPLQERMRVWDEYSPYSTNSPNPTESGLKLSVIIYLAVACGVIFVILLIYSLTKREKLFLKKGSYKFTH